MTVSAPLGVKKFLLSQGDPAQDGRETWLIIANWTKAATDAAVTWVTGLSSIDFAEMNGNVISKSFYRSATSGGTVTFNDGGTSANTAAYGIAIGRK